MLHALLDYARQEKLAVEPGFRPKTVRWLVEFSFEGRFLGLYDLTGGDRKSKGREFPKCPDLSQPELIGAGSGARHFLVDGLDVIALLTKDGQVDEKLQAKHAYFADLLEQASSSVAELAPLAAALRDEATLEAIRAKLAEQKAKPTDSATLALTDSSGNLSILIERDHWHGWWRAFRSQLAVARSKKGSGKGRKQKVDTAESKMLCLLSGELVEPQPTHKEKITSLSDVGGLSMGDALVSFDKEAFRSFGLQQAANAAMGETMVKTYSDALNHLIKYHSRRLAGTKVIYWYSGTVEPEDDPIRELLEGFGLSEETVDVEEPTEDDGAKETRAKGEKARARGCARRLLDAISHGKRPDLADFRYYALTLSANSGRVVIRDWMEGTFEQLCQNVNAWFDDLEIVHRNENRTAKAPKFAAVLAAPLRDLKDASAPLVTALWRCALRRKQPIPHHIMAQTLQRVRIDLIQGEAPRHARLGLLKAFCIREQRTPNMTTKLNEFETDPAYLCGRIMAVLARIQLAAMPEVGVGVVQRYYAAASATPALTLGRMVRTAQIAHLPKIKKDKKWLTMWFENQLAEIWNKLNQAPPSVLNLKEQTLFAMGYYQQNAKRFEGSKQSSEADTEGSDE